MDLKGEFISVDKLIRRRMKWQLLFQTIMTTMTSEGANLIEDMDKHLLNSKDIFKKANTKYKKKDISFSTGNRMKRSYGSKIKLRNNFKQTLSKSFHPDILQKDNKFDLSVVTCDNVEIKFYNSTEDIYNAKRTSPRGLTTSIRGISSKENVDYVNCTCPNLGSNKYAEFNNCHDFDNTELRRGGNEKVTKIKQAKKCVNEIAISLKKLKQNSNSCNNRSVQSNECNNLHPYQGNHSNDSCKPPKIFRRKTIEKDISDKPNRNENVFITLKYNTSAIDNQSFRSNADSKNENESIKDPTDNILKVPFVLLAKLECIEQSEACNKDYTGGNCRQNLFSNPNSSIKSTSTLEGIEEITDVDEDIATSNGKEDIFLNSNKDLEMSVVKSKAKIIKSNDRDVTILNCTEDIFLSPNKISNLARIKLRKRKENNGITHLNRKGKDHINAKRQAISNSCKKDMFSTPNNIRNISPVKLEQMKENNSDNKGITHLSRKEKDHLIGKRQVMSNNCKEDTFLSPNKFANVSPIKLKKVQENNSHHKEITHLNGKENEHLNVIRQAISNNCKEDTFSSTNKIPDISPSNLEKMKEDNSHNKGITHLSGKENDHLNGKRQVVNNNCKADGFLSPNKIPYVLLAKSKSKKMKKNNSHHKEIAHLNGKENEHVNGKRQAIRNNCKEDTFSRPNKIPNVSPVKLEKMKENNSDDKGITRLSGKENDDLNGKRQVINNNCKEDTYSSPNKIPNISPVKFEEMKENNSDDKGITHLNGKENARSNRKLKAISHSNSNQIESNKNKMLLESIIQNISFKEVNSDFDIFKSDGQFCISTTDKNYIKLYSTQINASGQYNEILEIVDFVQRQSPLITKYILGMQVMESLGETDSDRYKKLLKNVKKQVIIIAKTLKREHFETYLMFMLWQYEKRRKT